MRRIKLHLAVVWFLLFGLAAVALADNIQCQSGQRCNGTNGDDVITGTNGPDVIYAKSGSDRPIYGHDGGDWIHMGEGYDTAYGHAAGDHLFGGENGGTSVDRLIGNTGNDAMQDQKGLSPCCTVETDFVCGDDGDDRMNISDANDDDLWYGGNGNDQVFKDPDDVGHTDSNFCHGN